MYNLGKYIPDIAGVVATAWIARRFWGTFFERKGCSVISIAVWVFFFIFQMFCQIDTGKPHISTIFITALLLLNIAVWGYESEGKEKYFLLVIFCAVWVLVELFTFVLLSGIRVDAENLDVLGTIISQIFMVILIYILSVFWNKKSFEAIPNNFYLYFLFLSIGSIFVALNLFYSKSNRFLSTISVSILLLFNVVVFEIYIKMNELFLLEKEKIIYAQQTDIVAVNTVEQRKMMQEFHEEKHNFVNELIVLKDKVENSEMQDVIKSLDAIINNCYNIETISSSGNSTIDAIINFKYAVAREYGIDFNLKLFVPVELPIGQCDIGIVLGNALDNAIEAVRKCSTKKKVIDISMGAKKEALVLVIKNPYEHKIEKDRRGKIISSKEEKYRHGYGLKSIMKIAAKYQGDTVVDVADNIFSLTVVMNFGEL